MAHGDITHIEIPATDKAQAAQFYSTLFGWEIQAPPGFEDYPMWRAPNGISGGGLVSRGADGQPVSYVEVDSIDDIVAKLAAVGGSVEQPKQPIDENGWWAVITDLDGNRIGIYEGMTG